MTEIINWLINIEHLAGEIYNRAADYFSDDKDLKKFLRRMAEDEAWHFHIMVSAAENFRRLPLSIPAISVDKELDESINGLFQELSDKMDYVTLTKVELFNSLITAEFSEWNDIFLYVVNTLKDNIKEFNFIASRIQIHKKTIENYFESRPECIIKIASYKKLKPVWEERILIADDEDAIADFLEALLDGEGKIDKAKNGFEALELIKKNYYKLIISDIDMPAMDGISFYKAASEIFPDINKRIFFFTGSISQERKDLFTKNKLDHMTKPSGINLIREKALAILLKKEHVKSRE
jgi:CheY-like chemotaxis protein